MFAASILNNQFQLYHIVRYFMAVIANEQLLAQYSMSPRGLLERAAKVQGKDERLTKMIVQGRKTMICSKTPNLKDSPTLISSQ